MDTIKNTGFIFVVGGVLSGVGKGTIASSIGLNLQKQGVRVSAVKMDPYLNVDAGTISPYEHGEVYVLDDGTECDLDLGNYERFLGINLSGKSSITTGQVYNEVIQRERKGCNLGKTVQIIPHITDHIKDRIIDVAIKEVKGPNGKVGKPEVVIVELGGTVGDIESEPFLYTISQFEYITGARTCIVHVGLVVENNNELKTKPLQRSVEDLGKRKIVPDILCVRCNIETKDFPKTLKNKIGLNCHIKDENIIISGKVKTVYHVPKLLHKQKITKNVCQKLNIMYKEEENNIKNVNYQKILTYYENIPKEGVKIAIIAKYTGSPDMYLSLIRALEHAVFKLNIKLEYEFIEVERLEGEDKDEIDASFTHVIVPGGFGIRGMEGKIEAIRQARETKRPFLGICLGLQLLVIEHSRNQMGWTDANSMEFDLNTTHPVVTKVDTKAEGRKEPRMGGTMRLGTQKITIVPNTYTSEIYGKAHSNERHRHRYEISQYFIQNQTGMKISAWSTTDPKVPEIIENNDMKTWKAMGCQFHPEFISRNNNPHPIFVNFLKVEK